MREQSYMLPKSYRNIGLIFLVLAALIFISVFYLIWAKVTIIITSDAEKVSQEFVFGVKEGVIIADDSNLVPGKIKLINVEGSDTFTASGSRAVESDVVGEVTIINNYSKSQALVETTRLAAPSNPDEVLVRLKKSVEVLAGDKIRVQVYPDDPDNFKDIAPTKFIIPGLWGPLQDKIYAENEETLTQGGYRVSVLEQEDLEKAEEDLKNQLYQQALSEVSQELEAQETLWPKLVSVKVQEVGHDAEVGEEVAEFTTTMKLEAAVIVFDEDQLISLIRSQLKSLDPTRQLVDLDPKSFSYLVEGYNLETKEAQVKLSFEARSMAGNPPEFLDKSQLVGLTEEEVKSYFSQFEEVESVEVKFQPAWLKKTPRIKSKIEIQIGE